MSGDSSLGIGIGLALKSYGRAFRGLLNQYPGAAAAYSLRKLSGAVSNVVRVRRASDNDEEDFTASQVSSGELTNWVNSQIVPPLDIGVETSGGRIPVPEGGTSIGIPAAAYSLRNLSTTYTGNVVDVRRSSDDAEDSFTAAEVADGTLEAWVNGNWENVGYSTFTNGESWEDGFTAINTTSSSAGLQIPSGTTGDVITISFNLTLNSGTPSPSISLRQSAGGSIFSNVEFVYTAGSHSVTLTATGSYSHITIGESDVPSGFSISNVILNVVPNPIFDGFVSQWYDQSGNDNHATQGTDASQPMIVDGGSLVTGGIDFDGVNDRLSFDSSVSLSTNDFYFASVISILDGNAVNIAPVGNAAGNRFLISLNYDIDTAQMRADDSTFLTQPFTRGVPANETLISISNVSNTATLRCETISAAVFNTTGESFTLGNMGQYLPGSYSKHSIKELIIYTSDQSDNRTAIEANIGETYGITGIPAYDNTVDGFVETWYDQSGNGNDATQSVAASQPKIVDAGVLVSGGIDFDGVDDFFGLIDLDNSNQPNTIISVSRTDVTGSTRGIYGLGSDPSSASGYYRSSNNHTIYADIILGGSVYTSGTEYLRFDLFNGASSVIGVNGASTVGNSGNRTLTHLMIGDSLLSGVNPLNGRIRELIIYPTDQSSNRVGIETNINDHYNIY
jgi:hypothetical protein